MYWYCRPISSGQFGQVRRQLHDYNTATVQDIQLIRHRATDLDVGSIISFSAKMPFEVVDLPSLASLGI